MHFRITGLDPALFRPFFGQSSDDLARSGVRRVRADTSPGYPDRIALTEATLGETLLLLNYTHQPADSPYRASHAIFVRENATMPFDQVNVVPEVLRSRLVSLRGFDEAGMMMDADIAAGDELIPCMERLLADSRIRYLQAHYAKAGCYAARIVRA